MKNIENFICEKSGIQWYEIPSKKKKWYERKCSMIFHDIHIKDVFASVENEKKN